MRILISGASGLIGSAVSGALGAAGHEVVRLVRARSAQSGAGVKWDPEAGQIDAAGLEGFDGLIHLAGEGVADSRWTAGKKRRILASRVEGTRLVAQSVARLARRPRVFLCASAIGFYGDRAEEELDETSAPGKGFLPEVCSQWEAAAQAAADAGVRVVFMRTGMVLSTRGGALARMLPVFRWGLGGRLGSGRQYVSWITLEDVVSAMGLVLAHEQLHGPVNFTAPRPVTNAELTRALAAVLRRPALCPVPAWALRLALGEMAQAMLLSSARVIPRRLLEVGFSFGDPEIGPALQRLLRSGT